MRTEDHDKYFSRLLLTLQKLSNGEEPTIAELAQEFNVDARTIHRDISRLHFFPIEKENGKLRVINGYQLERSGLEHDELIIAQLGLLAVEDINEEFKKLSQSVRAKLSHPRFFSPYLVKPQLYESIDTNSQLLNAIEDAISNQNISKIISNGAESLIEPYRVVSFDGIWYLFAKDLKDSKMKTYLISQVTSFRASHETYTTKQKVIQEALSGVHSAWFEDGNSFEVTIKVQPCIAHYFRLKKHLASQEIKKEHEDGSLTITFEVSADEDVDNLIKAWLPHIEVLKPTRFREKLASELQSYLNLLQCN